MERKAGPFWLYIIDVTAYLMRRTLCRGGPGQSDEMDVRGVADGKCWARGVAGCSGLGEAGGGVRLRDSTVVWRGSTALFSVHSSTADSGPKLGCPEYQAQFLLWTKLMLLPLVPSHLSLSLFLCLLPFHSLSLSLSFFALLLLLSQTSLHGER